MEAIVETIKFDNIGDVLCPKRDLGNILIVMPPRCQVFRQFISGWKASIQDCEFKTQITLLMDFNRIDGYLNSIEEALTDYDLVTANTIRSFMSHDDRSFAHPDSRVKMYSTDISPLTTPLILLIDPDGYFVLVATSNGFKVAEETSWTANYEELVRRFQVDNLTMVSMLASPIPPINAGILPYLSALTAWMIVSNELGNDQSSGLLAKLRLAVLDQQNWNTVTDDLDWESVFRPYMRQVDSGIQISFNKENRLIEIFNTLLAFREYLDESIKSETSRFMLAIEEHFIVSI